MINRKAVKAESRGLAAASRPSPILTALIYTVISYVLSLMISQITGITEFYQTYYTGLSSAAASGNQEALYNAYINIPSLPSPGALAWGLSALLLLMDVMLQVGLTIFCIKTARGEGAAIGNLFDGFGSFLRVMGLELLIYVFTLLWSMLLLVPGLIAAYSYRQALYLLLDNPEMGVLECIRESKRMMRGHKWELLCWDLSFLGWQMLNAVLILPILDIWILPYAGISYVKYYDALRSQPDPLPGPEIF